MSEALSIGLLNGPNLDILGKREPAVYGNRTLKELEAALMKEAADMGVDLKCFQSNHEGALIESIHYWEERGLKGVIMNPAGYGHTSVALLDAILGSSMPFIEVHLTNIAARESYRHTTLTAQGCLGSIYGFGHAGYSLALRQMVAHLKG